MIDVIVIDSKYTVRVGTAQEGRFIFECLRYDEPWRDLTGDNLALAMAQKIRDQQEEITNLISKLEV